MKFNINDCVWVKLTDKGRAILKTEEDEYRNDPRLDGCHFEGAREKNGYTEFQLWDLMRLFGEGMFNGCELSFETTIYIGEEPPEQTCGSKWAKLNPALAEHRWSGWPGAWCLDCGAEDPGERALADGCWPFEPDKPPEEAKFIGCDHPEHQATACPCPGEGRADPYKKAAP